MPQAAARDGKTLQFRGLLRQVLWNGGFHIPQISRQMIRVAGVEQACMAKIHL